MSATNVIEILKGLVYYNKKYENHIYLCSYKDQ